jgi:hypothetical protein
LNSSTKAEEWLEESSKSLNIGQDALLGAPEVPWVKKKGSRKLENWRFSGPTLGRILGDEPKVLHNAEWQKSAEAEAEGEGETNSGGGAALSFKEDFASNPNYKQVVVNGSMAVSGSDSSAGGIRVLPATASAGEEVVKFLDDNDAKRQESPGCPEPHFFDHLGRAMAQPTAEEEGRQASKQQHLVIQVEQSDASNPHIVHILQEAPTTTKRPLGDDHATLATTTSCWAPTCSVVVKENQELTLIEEVTYDDAGGSEVCFSCLILSIWFSSFAHFVYLLAFLLLLCMCGMILCTACRIVIVVLGYLCPEQGSISIQRLP